MNYNSLKALTGGRRGITEQFDSEGVVRRILEGDPAAEEKLILRFQPAIRAFLSARARPELVEEVTQETMIAVICAVREGKLRESSSLGAFVYGVARLQLADAVRRHAREVGERLPDNYDHAAPHIERELLTAARSEIAALNEADRRIVYLTLIQGLRAAEIAQELGMSPEQVRKRKSRALQRITERLAPRSQNGAGTRLSSVKAP